MWRPTVIHYELGSFGSLITECSLAAIETLLLKDPLMLAVDFDSACLLRYIAST
jgi:hypothetical protein